MLLTIKEYFTEKEHALKYIFEEFFQEKICYRAQNDLELLILLLQSLVAGWCDYRWPHLFFVCYMFFNYIMIELSQMKKVTNQEKVQIIKYLSN